MGAWTGTPVKSTKERNIALYQGNKFINVDKTFFDKHYAYLMKETLKLSI